MSTRPPRPSSDVTVAQPVRLRADAIIDPARVHLAADVARKRNAFPGYLGYPSGMSDQQTHLRVVAWVSNLAYEKAVWLDLHLFDRSGALLRSETLPLRYDRAAGDGGDGGDLFVLDGVLLPGSGADALPTHPRPDARALQYRLYCGQAGRVLTDGLAHWRELRMDSSSG
jgi:hypothetical protein